MKSIIIWLIATFLPGHHLSKNPAKGVKKVRKPKADTQGVPV